jgi:hypothetical protein
VFDVCFYFYLRMQARRRRCCIFNVGLGKEVVRLIGKGKPLPILSSVELRTFEADRGLTWKDAFEKFSTLTGNHDGFYVSIEVSFRYVFESFFLPPILSF